ncbi:hypothetical protein WG901_08655 [Novosphingobium sp. PS1R-30]|uniref:alpha-L-rhamnosidase n=1 Tax=Novosphingobium anseongense TaxID=3133436 RepID=A0ABU8RVB4_9SPHN
MDADGVWTGDFHLGDWLDPGAPPDRPEDATTDRDLIASTYLARSARVVAYTALTLDRAELARSYAKVGDNIAASTWRKWSSALGKTQAGCAIAIAFDIAPVEAKEAVGRQLAKLVESNDGRIATGFLGTPLVLPALTQTCQTDAAFRLLLNEKAPGWLYQVANGATTMWERWDAIRPGGEIHSGDMAAEDAASMTSFNH